MFPGGSRIFVTDRVGPPLLDQNRLDAFRYVQDCSVQKKLQDVCGQFQACTSAQTNQTPDLTLTRTPTLWGARIRQGPSHGSGPPRILVAFFTKKLLGVQDQPRKTRIPDKAWCPPVQHTWDESDLTREV